MAVAFRAFASAGVIALFDEASGGGDVHDINAPRNAPALHPEDHLDKIYFHSALNNLELVSETSTTISHASVAASTSGTVGASGGVSGSNGSAAAAQIGFNKGRTNHNLVTHNLGYEPLVLVIAGTRDLSGGLPVQALSSGRVRVVTPYVTTTQVRLSEWSTTGDTSLPAVSVTYRVLVFRNQRAASGNKLFDVTDGVVSMGKDRFNSGRRYLQVVPGGAPYGIAYGKTIDLNNGAPRFVDSDGSAFDPIPSSLRYRLTLAHAFGTYTGALGATMDYKGSFTGSPSIQVQAP